MAGRQAKQVRPLDRIAIPVTTFYRAKVSTDQAQNSFPTRRLLRTFNDKANHLGLPLPSGPHRVFCPAPVGLCCCNLDLLLHRVGLEQRGASRGCIRIRNDSREQRERVHISNFRPKPIRIELHMALCPGAHVIRTDHPWDRKKGEPVFSLAVPRKGSAALQYQIRLQTQTKIP